MEISVSFENGKFVCSSSDSIYPARKERSNKGKSLISFPDSYCIIDIETTGLSPSYDNIIEISSLKIENNTVVDKFSSLVKPNVLGENYVDEFITELTGITNEMLSSAPSEKVVIPIFKEFIGSSILVGHNIHFDINFLYDSFESLLDIPLSNDFVDIMRLSRRIHSELPSHRLYDIAELYGIDYSAAHRSLKDCEITYNCYLQIKNEIENKFESLDSFSKSFNCGVRAKDIHSTNQTFDETNMLYQKVVVFTGVLEKMTRKDAMQIVANLGGINGDSVTKKTNYLVLGNNDYCSLIKDGKSNKQKKAEQLKLQGFDIEVIPESVFYEMLPET